MSRTSVVICLVFFVLCGSRSAWAEAPDVLVINSYHAGYPWVVSHNNALRRELKGKANLVFFFMDTKRTDESEYQAQADRALAQYEYVKPRLVVLADDNALRYLGNRIAARGTPVVYMGINDNPRNYLDDTTLLTGVLERPLLKRSIVFIKDILGELDKCLVMFDNGTTAHALVGTVFRGRKTVSFAGTQTDIFLAVTFAQWKKVVLDARRNGYGAIILGLYHTIVDETGRHVPAEVVARWTSAHSPVPVFAFWDFAVGKGLAVGGLILVGETQGEAAAALILRILKGESPGELHPVTAEYGRFVFSNYELERWGLDVPSHLIGPEDSLEYVE